jgi:hypothetical protein
MVKRHYLEMQDENAGKEWFSTTHQKVTRK